MVFLAFPGEISYNFSVLKRDSQCGESMGNLYLPHWVWPRKCEGGKRLVRAQDIVIGIDTIQRKGLHLYN